MSANCREIFRSGFTYRVIRRIVQRKDETVLRVRVQCYKGLGTYGTPEWDRFEDYTSIAHGDAIYAGHIRKLEG